MHKNKLIRGALAKLLPQDTTVSEQLQILCKKSHYTVSYTLFLTLDLFFSVLSYVLCGYFVLTRQKIFLLLS